MQYCSISIALAMEILQSCTKPSKYTHPFSNFNSATVEVWEWINNVTQNFIMDVSCNYLSMIGLMSNYVNIKGAPEVGVDIHKICGVGVSGN